MRLFVAINFDGTTVNRLLALRNILKMRSTEGKFSEPQNMHLTLAFLGECDDKQALTAKKAVEAMQFEPFDLTVEKMGIFKQNNTNDRSAVGNLWWAGVRPDAPLLALQKQLTAKLKEKGFALEKRKFHPHITLGREVVTDREPWHFAPFGERVEGIDLMKSERVRGRLVYTKVNNFRAYNLTCTK